jgi:hypothetical protein
VCVRLVTMHRMSNIKKSVRACAPCFLKICVFLTEGDFSKSLMSVTLMCNVIVWEVSEEQTAIIRYSQ